MKNLLSDRSPSSQRIVERQLRNWELWSRRRGGQQPCAKPVCDFITVSREIGGHGEEVAAELGRRLGWKVYDRELLELMAENETGRRQLYSTMDERDQTWFNSLSILWAPETLSPREDYLHALCRTVFAVAREAPAIFVGRGAHLILPPDVGLRVRIIAALEDRVARYAAAHNLAEPEARRAIKRLENQRLGFLQNYFGIHADDPEYYDLAVNTSRLSVVQACDVILTAHRGKQPPA